MKVNEIYHIAKNICNLPYKSIMFDGCWGIGKSYEIERAFKDNSQFCIISLFGINNCQGIFSKLLFKLGSRNKTVEQVYKITGDLGKAFLEHMGIDKTFSDTSKGLTLKLLKKLRDENYIIVFDDLERVGRDFNFEEFLGIVEELLQFDGIKVILVANTKKFEKLNVDVLSKYHEKVIDKIYKVDQLSSDIAWNNLRVEDDTFAERYIESFNIKNLRIIQKAEQFFKDVKIKINEGKINIEDDFLLIIKKICYSIVVEDIEMYGKIEYERKNANESSDKISGSNIYYRMMLSEFHLRVGQYYLKELKGDIFDSMIKMLAEYYKNSKDFDINCIEIGIDLYKKMGQKRNFFKSDYELNEMIIKLQNELSDSIDFLEGLKNADIILIWMDVLGIDPTEFSQKMKKTLETLIDEAVDKNIEIDKTYTLFSLQNERLKEYIPDIFRTFENKKFEKYFSSIKQFENTGDYNNAYLTIKAMAERTWYDIDESKFEELLNQDALPLGSISEEQWRAFRKLKDLFMQTDGRRKLWNEYIQNEKENNKDDKAFLNRIRSIEE